MEARLGSGEMVHFTCIFLKVTRFTEWWSQVSRSHLGHSSACALLGLPHWLPEGRGTDDMGVLLVEAAPRPGTSGELGELTLLAYL